MIGFKLNTAKENPFRLFDLMKECINFQFNSTIYYQTQAANSFIRWILRWCLYKILGIIMKKHSFEIIFNFKINF